METPPLIVKDLSDANELISHRIQRIYAELDGGLGEFFERLQREQSEREPSFVENDGLREISLNPVGLCEETLVGGDD